MLAIKSQCSIRGQMTGCSYLKQPFYNKGGGRIRDQYMPVFRRFCIAIGGKVSDKSPFIHSHLERRTDFS